MGPNAETAVVGFHDTVDELQDLTTSPESIETAFRRLDYGISGSHHAATSSNRKQIPGKTARLRLDTRSKKIDIAKPRKWNRIRTQGRALKT